jgi:hypothetical protein
LIVAAMTRPLNLVAPGAGLLLSLTYAPWWTFPLSLVAYAAMVVFSARDPKLYAEQQRADSDAQAGEPINWVATGRQLGRGEWVAPLERIAASEKKLGAELEETPERARALFASTLGQVRAAARLGIDLARKLAALDRSIASYTALNPQESRRQAEERRCRAASAGDEEARRAFLEAAKALDESAASAESVLRLRERTLAQLDSLAVSLENVAVRSLRLRVAGDGGPGDVAETLRVDVEAIRETLGVFEEEDPSLSQRERERQR